MENCATDLCNGTIGSRPAELSRPANYGGSTIGFLPLGTRRIQNWKCVIVADDILHIIDYKHGLGILVETDHNPQMMCYALLFDGIYDISTIRMTIFQPRRENVSTYECTKEELLVWANSTLAPTATLALNGQEEFAAGDHCQFCKVKATCRKRAEHNLELAKYDFAMPETLDKLEIYAILEKVDTLTAWANDIKEYALQQALSDVT